MSNELRSFKDLFRYDENSPTKLMWITPRKGRGGAYVERRNGGIAGMITKSGASVNIGGKLVSCKNIVWELFNGEIEDGCEVLFKDSNHKNLDISNLYLRRPLAEFSNKYGEYLRDYFYYDATSPSCLRWRMKWGASSKIKVGGVAGSFDKSDGYWRVNALGGHLKAHRIVWVLFNGSIEDCLEIDHKDKNPSNNSICNLRLVTGEINQRNKGRYKNNSSGVNGVSFSERVQKSGAYYSKYTARVYSDGKPVSKSFSIQMYGDEVALKLAAEWRNKMIQELNAQGAGYSPGHGK